MIRTLLFTALVSASTFSFAGSDRMGDMLVLELGLDDTRAEQVKTILTEARTEGKALKKAYREKMSEHRESTRAEIAEILTEEEMAKFEELHSRKYKKMKHHGREFRGRDFDDKDSDKD